jgi:hypothetical protein
MVKWYLLKLFQEWGKRDKGEWWRRWIQVWHIWYIARTFINATIYPHPAWKYFLKTFFELWGLIKRPTLQICDIQEGTKIQTKGIQNIFNKSRAENFLNQGEKWRSKYRAYLQIPDRCDYKRTPCHFIVKNGKGTEQRKNSKSCRKEFPSYLQMQTYQITTDLLAETPKVRKT